MTPKQAQAHAIKIRQQRIDAHLNKSVTKIYGTWDAFWALVDRVGNPRDQIDNFLRYGYLPQPKQLEFHAQARLSDHGGEADEIGFGGARGGGKSHTLFAQIILDDCQRFEGLKGLYVRQAAKKAKEQFQDLIDNVLRFVPKKRYTWSSHSGVMQIFGCRVIIAHFKREDDIIDYLGLEYDEIVLEEATALQFKFYKAILDANRSSKDGWRPRVCNSTNPGGIGHNWYKKRFINPWREEKQDTTAFIQAVVDDNQFVNPEYTRRLEANVGWKKRAHRFGDWDIAAGQYFSEWRHDRHVVKSFSPPSDWTYWAAMDIGHSHWNMVYLFVKSGDGTIYVIDELAHRGLFPEDIAPEILLMLERWELTIDDLEVFVAGSDAFYVDAKSGNSDTVANQYVDYGIDLTPALTKRGSRVEGARMLTKVLGNSEMNKPPTLFVFGDNCPKLVECIPAMVHNPNRPDDVLKVDADSDTGAGGDDPYDCLRYGIYREDSEGAKTASIVKLGKNRRRIHQIR